MAFQAAARAAGGSSWVCVHTRGACAVLRACTHVSSRVLPLYSVLLLALIPAVLPSAACLQPAQPLAACLHRSLDPGHFTRAVRACHRPCTGPAAGPVPWAQAADCGQQLLCKVRQGGTCVRCCVGVWTTGWLLALAAVADSVCTWAVAGKPGSVALPRLSSCHVLSALPCVVTAGGVVS